MHCDRIRQNMFDQKLTPNHWVSVRNSSNMMMAYIKLLLRKTMVGPPEKRHRTIVFAKKSKTSSFDIVVREPLGFGQKWSSEPWFSNRKYMSSKHFLSKTQ